MGGEGWRIFKTRGAEYVLLGIREFLREFLVYDILFISDCGGTDPVTTTHARH